MFYINTQTIYSSPIGKYKVISIPTGRRALLRLISMGIRVGVTIEIIQNSAMTPVILKVKGTTLAIGRGIASKVLVEKLK